MELEFQNTKVRMKNPIRRNHMFFGEDDIDLEMEFATEYLEHDANQMVILYRVDLSKTQVNGIYNEADKGSISYLPPIEVPCIYEVQDAEKKAYDKNKQKGMYVKPGKLILSVLLKTFEELDIDIKRGDYVGVQITKEDREYFTVINDGKVGMMSNKSTIYGTRPYYRTIECAYVDPVEFNG